MQLSRADKKDAEAINALLNLAYRGEVGWTTERALVSGPRSQLTDVQAMLAADDTEVLLYRKDRHLLACISLQVAEQQAWIGAFAVHPEQQAAGLGKAVLAAAEQRAITGYGVNKLCMSVVNERHELLAYYERRGYQREGELSAYPEDMNVGKVIVAGLGVQQLVKYV